MDTDELVYGRPFFQVLGGSLLTMVGLSMHYHFGEFVAYRGLDEAQLGWITGLGVAGSIALRPYAGRWIDRLGCRNTFLLSACVAAAANGGFLFAESLAAIIMLRIILVAATSTYLAAVAVYAALSAPPLRRAESLGTIGIGGFAGMTIGPAIGDAIFSGATNNDETFFRFFAIIAISNVLAGALVAHLPTPRHLRPPDRRGFVELLRNHWPGTILLVGVVFGAALTIHMSFLERFAHTRGFEDIRWFFFVYAPTAIFLRIFLRRIPQQVGRRRVCILGMLATAGGILLFIAVHETWQLIFPALLMGCGHAFVFPSMVDLAAEAMPENQRGLGTSVALGASDMGMLIGGITWGQMIDGVGYVPTFVTCAVAITVVTAIYAGRRMMRISSDRRRSLELSTSGR